MQIADNISRILVIFLLFSVYEALDICVNNKCKNGARCLPLYNEDYKCQCMDGYKGTYCDEISYFCHKKPCLNGARCVESPKGYNCQCPNGWYGQNCELNFDDCALRPCKNGGICKDLENHKYLCECPSNYIGMHCEHTDPCAEANPCGINGKCVSDNSGGYKCHCNKGFIGQACSIDIDECITYNTGLCENGGKCVNTYGSYRCECAKGYSGERCANDIVDCKNGTCKNGGTCLDKIGLYKCVCTEHFKGTNCEIPIPICETMPCKNQGQCRVYGNDFFCICPKPWKGKTCETRQDPCSENPCVNEGICKPDDHEGFKCICKPGYNGKLCESNIDECSGIRCQNYGICQDLINSWRCNCPRGFTGRYCEINTDECESRPCRNNGYCVDLINDYKCECPPGLKGKNCEIDIDECSGQPCVNGGRCEDRIGGFTCHCPIGFVGLRCESKSDICGQLSPCKNGGTCRNDMTVPGGYVCICPTDIASKDCSIQSRCVTLTCLNGGKCIDENDQERCICSPGFSGSRCETEIDECRNNPCQHGGSCQDLVNDYICHCPSGYRGKNCEIDINECSKNPCGPNGLCIDEINGFRCKCSMPYYGQTCSYKYDPCKSHICANDAICVPNYDYKSYHCNCSTAFGRFAGRYCDEDINECLLNQTDLISHQLVNGAQVLNGPCLNKGSCINTNGAFICKCPSGYHGAQCQFNTDDCINNPCKNRARCEDLISGYICHCPLGFTGENCEIEKNECESNPCKNSIKCNDHFNDYQCICMEGFSGKNCEINDDDCSELSCSGHGVCVDKINDFECRCSSGYRGKYCEHFEQACDSYPCFNNGSCMNQDTKTNSNGFLCNCRRGYSGHLCEIRMDWCRGSPCGDNGNCLSLGNSFRCVCNEGFIGVRCEIMKNETCDTFVRKRHKNQTLTSSVCNNNGFCFNQPVLGGFKCTCPSGFGGTFCEENIDDCANQPCVNGGQCKDGIGMYTCKCSPGFQGVNCEVNWNDCSSEPCNKGKCLDQVGNFTCICPRGTSGNFCEITHDKCKDVKCLNGGECHNNFGDFKCKCKKGFVGKTCEVDLNECRYSLNGDTLNVNEKPFGPCSPSGTTACLDGPGDFKCICRPGFYGRYCQSRSDICEDMKKNSRIACFNSGTCENKYDRTNSSNHGYRCRCPPGYGGDRCKLYNKRCQFNPCLNGGTCRPVDNGYKMSFVCVCPPGVGGLFCEKDYINECLETICFNGGYCLDGFGKAVCKCPDGFCGERCEIGGVNACNTSLVEGAVSYSEELGQCNRNLCNNKFNNKRCDPECNNLACGFDGGECLHKVPKSVGGNNVALARPWSNCTIIQTKNIPCHHWFMNGRCDPQCNIEKCLFDGWDCEKTIQPCPNKDVCDSRYGDNFCQPECNTVECDFDGGDCITSMNSTISGAIVLVLPVPTTVFVSLWQAKLLKSLTHLLHSIVRVKKLDGGGPMIYPIRVFVASVQDNIKVRRKRSAFVEDSQGKPGTKVYLEVDNSICKNTNNMCFDNTKSAAEFVSAALHSRLYRPPIPILSVQSDSGIPPTVQPSNPIKHMLIYVILVMTCLIILGILIGVLYGFMQNQSNSEHPKTQKAEIWFPEGMKRFSQTSSHYQHRRLGNSSRKRNQNTLNGLNLNSDLGNLPQMTKSKISTSDSVDDSGSNSLTSTRVTSYETNANENNNDANNISENCMLLSNGDLNCNFPPEKRLRLNMDSNKCTSDTPDLETWCFNAFVHLIVSGNGLGELTPTDNRDKQMIMEKLFHIANTQTTNDNPNMFTDLPNKKELTIDSLATILTLRLPYSGETLLHLAAKFNSGEAARFLLEAGSDPNKEDSSGRSCLLTAIDAGALEVITYLLEQQSFPIDIQHRGPGGVTSLIQAVKGSHLEIIHTLLQHIQPEECDLNVIDNYGRTALHWASVTNQIGVAQLLLSYGLNRDAQDNEEMTPLYLACREGLFDMCKLLIANGANPDMSDHLDRLPRDIANTNHFDDIVTLLDDYINLTKENQQHRPVVWGQYSYYSNNYYGHPMDFKSVLYSSPHSLNQMSCCVYPNGLHSEFERSGFYNSSLSNVAHSNNHLAYKGNSVNINDPLKKRSSVVNSSEHENPELKYHKQLKPQNCCKGMVKYSDYCPTSNGHVMSNLVATNSSNVLTSGGYPSNNPTSSTSAPGITPSPDSDSPGHWSTSSPSLSPRSKNQQNLMKHFTKNNASIHQIKPSVLHYRPSNASVEGGHQGGGLKTNEQCGYHSRNNICQY